MANYDPDTDDAPVYDDRAPPPPRKPKKHGTDAPAPKTDRRIINKRNRSNGSHAQTEWARLVHGRNVGILGREDVDDGRAIYEVKARKLPQWLHDAYAQVNGHKGNKLRYVVIRHPGKGGPVSWWVLQPAQQYLDVCGLGLYEPEEPKRRLRR